ncbi:MAG: CBS domain-containing protein, partial [Oscillospiraceae bacterium]|nr:CBS domain-containing protein [Oscillospiraceae bacterium]
PVVDGEGRLRGVVTDRDIVVRCVAAGEDPRQTPVREVMTRSVTTVSPSEDAAEAAKRMRAVQVRRLPVSDGKRVLGVVSLGDIARRERLRAEAAAAFAEVSSNKHRL